MTRRQTIADVLIATITCVALAAPAAAQVPDHLKCYKAKDTLNLAGTADLETPEFEADSGCKISKATLFCMPPRKTNVAVTDKATGNPITPLPVTGANAGHRVCYKVKCPAGAGDQTATDQFGTRTFSKLKVSLLCTPAFRGSARYVDNSDGTVIDNYMGLQWEKKDGAGGGVNLANSHDVDNDYTWSSSGTAADGTAYTDFLSRLNTCTSDNGQTVTTTSFAGHCDWRLPTIAELRTILLAPHPCGTSPCNDPVFGPTAAFPPSALVQVHYWTSTTVGSSPNFALSVDFDNGGTWSGGKTLSHRVRAVWGGS